MTDSILAPVAAPASTPVSQPAGSATVSLPVVQTIVSSAASAEPGESVQPRPPLSKRPVLLKASPNGVAVAGGVVEVARRMMRGRQLSDDLAVVLVNHVFKADLFYPCESTFPAEPPDNPDGRPMGQVMFCYVVWAKACLSRCSVSHCCAFRNRDICFIALHGLDAFCSKKGMKKP